MITENRFNKLKNTWVNSEQLTKIFNVTETPTLQVVLALYNTCRFKEALQIATQLKKDDASILIQQINKKLQEEQGNFNILQLYEQKQLTDEPLITGNYINKQLEIKRLEEFGRSFVAKSIIKKGTILTVEKAFIVGNLQQMEQLEKIRLSVATIDEQNAYYELKGDTIRQKHKYNAFGQGPQLNSLNSLDYTDSDEPSALMLTQSIYNHCCIPNAQWFFIGDIMFVVASQDIQENQQIFLRYQDKEPYRFMQTWFQMQMLVLLVVFQ
ncbi:SET_domain-containing protein [Hexamita inflata]|uniref:SET domain-containing protein n=1 Tax=Hexamita inflata TaxID=28002 RepID=A0AA86P9L7_9EUKA|nr:SET domain-containing protein [Hexamita inflata]